MSERASLVPVEVPYWNEIKGLTAHAETMYAGALGQILFWDSQSRIRPLDAFIEDAKFEFMCKQQEWAMSIQAVLVDGLGKEAADAFLNKVQAWHAITASGIYDISHTPYLDLSEAARAEGLDFALTDIKAHLQHIIKYPYTTLVKEYPQATWALAEFIAPVSDKVGQAQQVDSPFSGLPIIAEPAIADPQPQGRPTGARGVAFSAAPVVAGSVAQND